MEGWRGTCVDVGRVELTMKGSFGGDRGSLCRARPKVCWLGESTLLCFAGLREKPSVGVGDGRDVDDEKVFGAKEITLGLFFLLALTVLLFCKRQES